MDSSQLKIIITAIDEASASLAKISDSLKEVGAVGDEMNTQLADGAKASDAALSELTAATGRLSESMALVKDELATTNAQLKAQREALVANTAATEENTLAHDSNGKSMGKAGMAAAVLAVGVGYAIDKTVKAYSNYQGAVVRLNTSANEQVGKLSMVSNGMLSIARQTGTGADQLAAAMYYIESAGYHGASGLAVLTAAAKGAKDENADVVTVADAVSTVMVSYGKSIKSPTDATNAMIAAVSRGKTNLQDFSGSLATVLSVAHSAGIGFDQVAGAIATMTAQGMTAQNATQNLRNAIQHLQGPTQTQISFLQQLGLNTVQLGKDLSDPKVGLVGAEKEVVAAVQAHTKEGMTYISVMKQSQSATADATLAIKAMPPALASLSQEYLNGTISYGDYYKATKALPGTQRAIAQQFQTVAAKAQGFSDQLKTGSPLMTTYTAALQKATGSTSGMQTALMLSGDHAATFADNVNAIGKSLNSNAKEVSGWNEMQKTMGLRLAQLKEGFQTLGIEIGQAFAPVVTAVAVALGAVVTPIAALISRFPILAIGILGTVGAFATFVAAMLAIKKVTGWVSDANKEFKILIGLTEKQSVVAVVAAKAQEAWAIAQNALTVATTAFQVVLDALGIGELLLLIALIIAAIIALVKGIQMLIAHFGGMSAIMRRVGDDIESVWKPVAGFFVRVWGDIERVFKDGIWFLGQIWDSPMKAAQEFVSKFETVFPRLLGDLGYYGKKIIEEVITWGPGIVKGLLNLPGDIIDALSKGFDKVSDKLDAIGATLFIYIKKAFDKALRDAPLLLGDLLNMMATGAKDIQQEADAVGDLLYGKIKAGWDKASSKAKEIGKSLLNDIKGGISDAVNTKGAASATAGGQSGNDMVNSLFDSLGLNGKGGLEGKGLGLAKGLLSFDIGTLIDWTKSARSVGDKAGAIGTAIWHSITQGFKGATKGVSSWWDGVTQHFKNGIHLPSFNQIGKDIIGAITKGLKAAVKDIIGFFKNLPDLLKGDVHKSGADTAQHHVDGFSSLFGDHSKMMKIGNAILKGLGIAIGAVILGIILLAVSIVIAMINAMVKAIRETIHLVGEAIGKVGSLVKDALKDAANWLYDAGKKIIQGLAHGISDAAGDAVGAMKGVLGKISKLIPHSPAEEGPFSGRGWTLYSGQAISTALAQGIQDSGPQATSAMQRVMQGVAGATSLRVGGVNVGAAGSAGSQLSNGGMTVMSNGMGTTSMSSGTSGVYNFNLTVGVFTGSQGEMDAVAQQFWQSFQRIARQHGMAGNLPNIGVRPT